MRLSFEQTNAPVRWSQVASRQCVTQKVFQIMAILAFVAIMAISPLSLIHNMHIHRWRIAQEALNGIQV
jgi:hypothetical protein